MLAGLAARTVSGKTPPLAFRITLWLIAILVLGAALGAVVQWWRLRKQAAGLPDLQQQQGRSAQAGCLLIVAIPGVLLGLFLVDWAIQVS